MAYEVYSQSAVVVLGKADTFSVKSQSLTAVVGKPITGLALSSQSLVAVISNSFGYSVSSQSLHAVIDPPPDPVITENPVYFFGGPEANDTFVIPAGVTSIDFRIWGASGGAGQGYSPAGTLTTAGGAYVSGTLAVSEGDTISIQTGRAGGGAVESTQSVGLGGWPDGVDGEYDCDHEAYGGGQGGATILSLNGTEMARAGGSVGTAGFPSGGSNVPPDVASADAAVTNLVIEFPVTHVVAGAGNLPNFVDRPGYGVLNLGPNDAGDVDGVDGAALLIYYT